MEIETDEPIPTASQQALSGSNAGHLTVDFDSEDANYRAQVDELVRTIESMPFVSKLSQLGAPRPGFQSSLMCYAARGYKSCGCKQRCCMVCGCWGIQMDNLGVLDQCGHALLETRARQR